MGWKYLLIYCCWICVEAVLIFWLWPETSGRTLEELAFRKFPAIICFLLQPVLPPPAQPTVLTSSF